MAKPKDHNKPSSGKRVVKADGRRTSKTAGRTVHRSAKTGRFTASTYHRSSPRNVRRSVSSGAAAGQLTSGGFGCAEGMIWIAPDFDDPLEEFETDS